MIRPQPDKRHRTNNVVIVFASIGAIRLQARSVDFQLFSHKLFRLPAGDACPVARPPTAGVPTLGGGARTDGLTGGRTRCLLSKHSHRHLPSLDSRPSQDFHDALREPLRHVHE